MSDATVLVLSAAADDTANAVVAELDRRGAHAVRVDTGDFPIRLRLDARHDGRRWTGRLFGGDVEVDLERVGAVYYRRPTRFVLPPGLSDADAVYATAEARLGVGGVLTSLDALYCNRPARVAEAEYKPIGLHTLAAAGLRVPRTLVTNDHAAVMEFAEQVGGEVVCKTLSSLVLSEGDIPQAVYTTPVTPADIDPVQLAVTTHLIQEWIPKSGRELRVTMVGRTPYGVAIHAGSDAARIDWRADYPSLTYQRYDPPAEITAAMGRYLDMMGLHYGAFDLVETPSGEIYALECNPNGQWLWLQHETGLPIGGALADLLIEGNGL